MSHATGHPKRLNRNSITEAAPFSSPTYSFEEMVAEMSAAYLCAEAGISPAVLENQAAYIAGWLKKLKRRSKARDSGRRPGAARSGLRSGEGADSRLKVSASLGPSPSDAVAFDA